MWAYDGWSQTTPKERMSLDKPKREWCTRARQPMKELCTWARQLPIKDQLELENSNWELDISLYKSFVLELDNSQWIIIVGLRQFQLEEWMNASSWN